MVDKVKIDHFTFENFKEYISGIDSGTTAGFHQSAYGYDSDFGVTQGGLTLKHVLRGTGPTFDDSDYTPVSTLPFNMSQDFITMDQNQNFWWDSDAGNYSTQIAARSV